MVYPSVKLPIHSVLSRPNIDNNIDNHIPTLSPMASKDTPKKYYKKSPISTDILRGRLCNAEMGTGHNKQWFKESKLEMSKNAEII